MICVSIFWVKLPLDFIKFSQEEKRYLLLQQYLFRKKCCNVPFLESLQSRNFPNQNFKDALFFIKNINKLQDLLHLDQVQFLGKNYSCNVSKIYLEISVTSEKCKTNVACEKFQSLKAYLASCVAKLLTTDIVKILMGHEFVHFVIVT